ncbi:MAG: hypoxanthine phosphoribosyltransferase [Deltaproteobacteria bacterium]|nr:hypoxanthine phosphoribosyltransferase [Deltaproteobacteria bacterium]
MNYTPENSQILFTEEQIQSRIEELGKKITNDFAGKSLTMLVVLKGSFIFASDLARHIKLPMNIEFIGLRSYGDRISSSGVVEITMDLKHPIKDEEVLIVEDIVDTGLTIDYLIKNLKTRAPKNIYLASLLHKKEMTKLPVKIDYLGFEVPDKFVVGYGLDHAGKYRNLPFITHIL